MACRILVPRPGIESVPPALKVWHLNHWTRNPKSWVSFLGKVSPPKLFGAWAPPAAPPSPSALLCSEVIIMHVVMLLCAIRVAAGGSGDVRE